MGAELVIIPLTGESLSLDAPTSDLARALDDVADLKRRLDSAKRTLADEVLRRMDHDRAWTAHAGGFKVTGDSDAEKTEWDAPALAVVLTALVDEGLISTAAMDAAIEEVTTWKPKAKGLNALRKNPALAARIEACATQVSADQRTRYVNVTRAA